MTPSDSFDFQASMVVLGRPSWILFKRWGSGFKSTWFDVRSATGRRTARRWCSSLLFH